VCALGLGVFGELEMRDAQPVQNREMGLIHLTNLLVKVLIENFNNLP
jgi:hypothetical protein